MNRFTAHATKISGVYMLQAKPICDERGFFERFYCSDELHGIGLHEPIVQMNLSYSKDKGTVRGIHFQYPPCNEIKLVRCLQGKVLNVAIDLRKGSPTFLQHVAVELSAKTHNYLLLPHGTGHAFQTLTSDAQLLYLVTARYAHDYESGLNPLDPKLGQSRFA